MRRNVFLILVKRRETRALAVYVQAQEMAARVLVWLNENGKCI